MATPDILRGLRAPVVGTPLLIVPTPALAMARRRARPQPRRDSWGAGQGVGAVRAVAPAAAPVARLSAGYAAARARLAT